MISSTDPRNGTDLVLRALKHHLVGEIHDAVEITQEWVAQLANETERLRNLLALIKQTPGFIPAYLSACQQLLNVGNNKLSRKLAGNALRMDRLHQYKTLIQPFLYDDQVACVTHSVTVTSPTGTPIDLLVRPGTWDASIACEVISTDCYRTAGWRPARDPKFIVEVGAHIGSFATMMGTRYPQSAVLSFEMLPENFQFLQRNTENLDNVTVTQGAFGGELVPIAIHPCAVPENTGGGWVEFGPAGDASVPHHTLPGIFQEFSIDRIDLLKLDCEGSEFPILRHAVATGLIDRVDFLTMEVHLLPDQSAGQTMPAMMELIKSFPHWEIDDKQTWIKMLYAWR